MPNTQLAIAGPGNNERFNVNLGRALFSDPMRDRDNAVVVANMDDKVAKIRAGDLVRVDFTVNRIDGDGLYIITLDDGWIGYRFFQHMPALHMRDDRSFYPVTPEIRKSLKVVGKVRDIYRSTNAI